MSQPGDSSAHATVAVSPAATFPPARPFRRELAATAVAALTVALLGVPFGLLWSTLAPSVPVLVTEHGPAYAEAQPEQLIAADGWFAIMAIPFGIVLAVGVWAFGKRARGLMGLAGLTIGTIGSAMLAWWLGRQLGLGSYRQAVASAEPGTLLDRPPDLAVAAVGWWPPHVLGVLLVPALAGVATYAMLAAWSPYPSLRPDDEPVDERIEWR